MTNQNYKNKLYKKYIKIWKRLYDHTDLKIYSYEFSYLISSKRPDQIISENNAVNVSVTWTRLIILGI